MPPHPRRLAVLLTLLIAPACPHSGEPPPPEKGARSAGTQASTPAAPSPEGQALKALAFDLAHAGEFEAAGEAFERLAALKGDPLATTARFHYGNLLETSHVLDAGTAEELEVILERARAAYGEAVEDMAASPAAARRQAEMNLARVETKLERLRGIGDGGLSPVEISEIIDDMDAPAAAARSLEGRLDPGNPEADEFYFLVLVYRVPYLDHLTTRLANAWKLEARGGMAGSEEGVIEGRIERLGRVSEETESIGQTAIERFPASPHLLDFRLLTADSHRYHAQLEVFRQARQTGAEQAGGSGQTSAGGGATEAAAPAEAIGQLKLALAQERAALELVEAARGGTAVLSPRQRAAWPADALERYAARLTESLASDEALLKTMSEPAGAGGGPAAVEEGEAP